MAHIHRAESDVRCQMSDVRDQGSGIRDQGSVKVTGGFAAAEMLGRVVLLLVLRALIAGCRGIIPQPGEVEGAAPPRGFGFTPGHNALLIAVKH
jgi:hypothetical protein